MMEEKAMSEINNQEFFSVRDLVVEYTSGGNTVHAVNGVSFSLKPGQAVGLVGETGAGKTTIAKSILRILPGHATKKCEGEIIFDGRSLLTLSENAMREIRGGQISMIFQDPMTALNPVMTVSRQIAEGYLQHHNCSRMTAENKAIEMLETVGIKSDRAEEYPHQFSGGMKQRVVIAMALACSPRLLIADEPTTALDVTIQAQVLNLINKLKKEMDTALILITHDLGVVANTCDFVNVVYAGRIIESGDKKDVFLNPKHPYTIGLIGAIPDLNKDVRRLSPIEGLPPDPTNLPQGCAFYERCSKRCDRCLTYDSTPYEVTDGHFVSCCNLD